MSKQLECYRIDLRNAPPFGLLVLEYVGPLCDSGRFKYDSALTDLNTRFSMAYALTSITAKKICHTLIDFLSFFSMLTVAGLTLLAVLKQLLLKR